MRRKLVTPAALCLTAALVGLPAVRGAAAPPRGLRPRVGFAHGAGRAAAPMHLSIMVGGLSKQIYLPNELTQRLGYFAQQGLDMRLIDEASGQSSENEVLAGAVQAGSGAYNHTIELQALGKYMTDVVQLGDAPGEAEMVATKEAGRIKSFKDLRGRKLGITEFGSGTQTLSSYLAVRNGIPVSEVHFVPVGAGDTFIAAIQHGTIDAGMTTEPTISRLVQSGLAKVLVDLRTPASTRAALGGDYPFICLFMKTDYVTSHKAVVQKVVNAYVKTLKWIHTHSAAQIAAKMPADYYAGNKALYVTALEGQLGMFSPDGRMPSDGPASVLKVEQQFNSSVQGKHIDLSKTYDGEFVANANK